MSREAIDEATGYERSSRATHPQVRTPKESPVKWTGRRKGSLVEVTVEVTYWIDPSAETPRQSDGAAAAITGEDFYDGDSGTISIV